MYGSKSLPQRFTCSATLCTIFLFCKGCLCCGTYAVKRMHCFCYCNEHRRNKQLETARTVSQQVSVSADSTVNMAFEMHSNASRCLTQPCLTANCDACILPSSADWCVLGNVYLRSDVHVMTWTSNFDTCPWPRSPLCTQRFRGCRRSESSLR